MSSTSEDNSETDQEEIAVVTAPIELRSESTALGAQDWEEHRPSEEEQNQRENESETDASFNQNGNKMVVPVHEGRNDSLSDIAEIEREAPYRGSDNMSVLPDQHRSSETEINQDDNTIALWNPHTHSTTQNNNNLVTTGQIKTASSENQTKALTDKANALFDRFLAAIEELREDSSSSTELAPYILENESQFRTFLEKAQSSERLELNDIPPIPSVLGIGIPERISTPPMPNEYNAHGSLMEDASSRLDEGVEVIEGPIRPCILFKQRLTAVIFGSFFRRYLVGKSETEICNRKNNLFKLRKSGNRKKFDFLIKRCIFLENIFHIWGLRFLLFGTSLCHLVLTTELFNLGKQLQDDVLHALRDATDGETCYDFQDHPLSWIEASFPLPTLFLKNTLSDNQSVKPRCITGTVTSPETGLMEISKGYLPPS